jgi:hypothetical protein
MFGLPKLASSNDGQLFYIEKTTFRSVFANNSVFNLHFMTVSTEKDNHFGYEKITIVADNQNIHPRFFGPLLPIFFTFLCYYLFLCSEFRVVVSATISA